MAFNPKDDGLEVTPEQAQGVKQSNTSESVTNRTKQINVRFKQHELDLADKIAASMGINRSSLIRIALNDYIAKRGGY